MDRNAVRQERKTARKAFAMAHVGPVIWPEMLWSLCRASRCIGGYWPLSGEISPVSLLETLAREGRAIALPAFENRRSPMQFRRWRPGDPLDRSPFGFRQPHGSAAEAQPDLVLVPLVAFDRLGNRLGQGAGHYDRYLSLYSNCLRIGLGWSNQELPMIIAEPWDVALHAIATENAWIATPGFAALGR